MQFDPQKDLAPASLAANQAFVVAATQSLLAANLQEFIAPALRERFLVAGLEPLGSTPEAFSGQLQREIPNWRRVAKDANIQVD